MTITDELSALADKALSVEPVDPRSTAQFCRDQLTELALSHPEFTTADMRLMAPTMVRLKELAK